MDGIRTLIKTGYGAVGAVGGSGGGQSRGPAVR